MGIDAGLVEHARSGGPALDRLIETVWPDAFRLAFCILRDRGLAEDAAQEACAAIVRSLPSLRRSEAFAAWSRRVVVNEAIAASRRRPQVEPLDAVTEPGVAADTTDALDLYDALAALTPLQRATIVLHYYAGLTSAEIAAATRLPSSTIRFHLMRARRALRKALSRGAQTHSDDEVLSHVQ